MKVKFISKKQRELLKQQKNGHENTHVSSEHVQNNSVSEKANESTRLANLEANKSEEHHKVEVKDENVNFSEHFMAMQKNESDIQPRERSRDAKYQQLLKDDIEQRNKMKSKMLGLTKMELSQRRNVQYRSQLLFEWDKKEDTSQGFIPILTELAHNKTKDILTKENMGSWKDKPFDKMQDRDWRIFRQDHQIYIRGGKAPNPIRQWREIQGIKDKLVDNLLKLNFERPKPIQMQAIPIGMSHRDLMAIAPTGQGKTLAYLLPIIHFLIPLERLTMETFDAGPYALIVVPTRELAQQIQHQFKKIAQGFNLKAFVAVGGYQFQLQSIELNKGCEILIATPGRVKQFIEKHQLSLQRLSWCIIDEADKMVSENLAEDLQFILQHGGEESLFNGKKIIHMFSATMIPEIQQLGKAYLSASFTYITIGEPGGGKKEIDQHVELIDQSAKMDRLSKIIRNLPGPMIVFVNSRENCDKVSKMIQKRCERRVSEYHGGKNQETREKVIANLRTGKIEILVATDLAGRGLDVKGISAVINYDAPKNISQFIHRSGRTGRAGMKGKAFTFLTSEDQGLFYDLRVFLERNGFSVPQNLKEHPSSQVRPGGVLTVARRKQIVYTN